MKANKSLPKGSKFRVSSGQDGISIPDGILNMRGRGGTRGRGNGGRRGGGGGSGMGGVMVALHRGGWSRALGGKRNGGGEEERMMHLGGGGGWRGQGGTIRSMRMMISRGC